MSETSVYEMTAGVRALIYGALAPTPPDDLGRRAAGLSDEEWKSVLHLVRQHRVGPMLCFGLSRTGALEEVPKETADHLKQQQRRWGMRNLKTHAELIRVCGLLDEAGIESIALKGAYLATFAYPSLGLRPLRDIDLLVSPDDGLKAFKLLQIHGYVPEEHGHAEAYVTQVKHLPSLDHPNGVSVELHLRLTSPLGDWAERPLMFPTGAQVWPRAVSRQIAGYPLRFLGPEDLLLHLALHAAVDHRMQIGPLAVADIAWLLATHSLDWFVLLGRAREAGLERALVCVLALAQSRLGADIPPEVFDALGGGDSRWFESVEHLVFADDLHGRLMRPNVRRILFGASKIERLNVLLGRMWVPREAVAAELEVSGRFYLLPWYYLCYWWRLSRKAAQQLAQVRQEHRTETLQNLIHHRNRFDGWLDGTRED